MAECHGEVHLLAGVMAQVNGPQKTHAVARSVPYIKHQIDEKQRHEAQKPRLQIRLQIEEAVLVGEYHTSKEQRFDHRAHGDIPG